MMPLPGRPPKSSGEAHSAIQGCNFFRVALMQIRHRTVTMAKGRMPPVAFGNKAILTSFHIAGTQPCRKQASQRAPTWSQKAMGRLHKWRAVQASMPGALSFALSAIRTNSEPLTWIQSSGNGSLAEPIWEYNWSPRFKFGSDPGFQYLSQSNAAHLALSAGRMGPSKLAVGLAGGTCLTHLPSLVAFSCTLSFHASKRNLDAAVASALANTAELWSMSTRICLTLQKRSAGSCVSAHHLNRLHVNICSGTMQGP